MRPATPAILLLLFAAPGLAASSSVSPQEEAAPQETAPEESAPEESAQESAAPAEAEAGETGETDVRIKNVCDLPDLASVAWIDRMHHAVYRSVCGSAFWFDSFFGEEDAYRQRDATFGRAGLAPHWSEQDGFELKVRFKAKIHLPRLEKRLNAFLGNYDEDEFEQDRSPSFGGLPQVFQQNTDQEWLAGLGYSPLRGKRRRIDIDAGVKLDFPLDPFVRVRSQRYHFFNEVSLLRFRQTLFWRGERGLGTTSHLDIERLLARNLHVRWSNLGTIAEAFDGVDWESRLTLYHYLGGSRAFAYELSVKGETEAPVTVESYGFEMIYRQSAFRDWFFLELRGGLAWPRYLPEEIREESFGVGFGFELLFGDHP
jgi:hypothetical protein